MSTKTPYDGAFYASFEETSLHSARVLVPLVMDLVKAQSVADVGCGLGVWLSVFREFGASSVMGFDGDYVDRARLRIPPECFRPTELAKAQFVGTTFDLAVSLEVAEHLPPESSTHFVSFLTSLAPVLLFSAAIPEQPGTAHINPRWHSFWHAEFRAKGYRVYDPFRPTLWHNERVSLHYRQNVFLYAKEEWLDRDPRAAKIKVLPEANCLTLIDQGVLEANLALRATLRRLPSLVSRAILRR
ncbi:MAG TPA: methyltransferase domain-containing protein [Kiritimatiellia bacterium]|nr:methyltransferase domain-containing protein [Kiritimatiellia bacterium]